MKTALTGCLLLMIAIGPALAQTTPDQKGSNALDCPMMTDEIQNQMGSMMKDMQAMMKGTADPATKSRMQAMHERMGAMMANMKGMHGRMMGSAPETKSAPDPSRDQKN